ncbi:hypothetical protein IMCC3317_32750 [Kordia antarctica]|uniref:DUF4270 domain-containing protein n=1 Tax=Kordia antarctica TaxID=1218801 RepID=A0A7L4ZMK3_9FLAO|nr:DUF4270 domain-containing protein [Kordia antarctica]QHI37892.1 hypothetical protein IMCC3317_32750 [Kordia antarctica]
MNRFKKTLTGASVVLLIVLGFVACDDEFSTVGDEIIENNNFSTDLFAETIVNASNKRLNPVQTNGLPVYQLGKNDDPVFGTTFSSLTVQASLITGTENPEFGDFSQAEEDADLTDFEEEEMVTEVWLNIPFFSSSSVDDAGETVVEVDSLYGNIDTPFTLSVKELTYFLRSVDPNGDPQAYFSDEDYAGLTNETLFEDAAYVINTAEIEVGEVDASGQPVNDDAGVQIIEETLSPRIRVKLNSVFFQQRIINNEGSIKLSNNNVFRAEDLFRGLHITADDAEALMLLDFQNANIEINYTYNKVNTQGNTDASDDTTELEKAKFLLSLSSANIVNTFSTPTFGQNVATTDNLFLKGGEGSMSTIELFGPDTDGNGVADQLEEIRENGWIINDANLVFYVNNAIQVDAAQDPQRIYLYNMDDAIPLQDYIVDQTVNPTSLSLSKAVHGGILERDDAGIATQYKIRLTEHINNVIRKDSTNVVLGLVSSSDIRIISSGQTQTGSSELDFVPTVSIMNPFGTVLHGSTPATPEDKRLKLEIFYSIPGSN